MLRKNEPVTATPRRLAALEDLKNALVNAPILGIFRQDGEILVDVDTSATSCGAVCSQEQDGVVRVLEYASRCLSLPERNLCAYRRETLGLIFALKKFRTYLLGRTFRVRVDNLALKSLLTVRNPTGVVARHLDFLADYNFTLEHRPGAKRQNCDSLSRLRPCSEGPDGGPCKQCQRVEYGTVQGHVPLAGMLGKTAPMAAANLGAWNPENLRAEQLKDPDIGPVLAALETNIRPGPRDLKSLSPALRALFLQFDSLVLIQGALHRLFIL